MRVGIRQDLRGGDLLQQRLRVIILLACTIVGFHAEAAEAAEAAEGKGGGGGVIKWAISSFRDFDVNRHSRYHVNIITELLGTAENCDSTTLD